MADFDDEVTVTLSNSGRFWLGQPTYRNTDATFHGLKGKKPYLLNLVNSECIVGEWNKDKTEYGLRVFFASGNSTWIGTEASLGLLSSVKGANMEDVIETFKQIVGTQEV